MKVLAVGTSVTAGYWSWPAIIANELQADLTNLSYTSAGNRYIHDAVIEATCKDKYDLVLVNWTHPKRLAIRTPWHYAYGEEDSRYLNKSWAVTGCRHEWPELDERGREYERAYYRITSTKTLLQDTLVQQVGLQGYLKGINVNYIMTNYKAPVGTHRFPELHRAIDRRHYVEECLKPWSKQLGLWDTATHHPSRRAHSRYADIVLAHLDNLYHLC